MTLSRRRPFHSLFSWPAFDAFFESIDDTFDPDTLSWTSSIVKSEEAESITEDNDKAVKEIHFRLPGLKREDVDISIKDGVLTIHSKQEEKDEKRSLKNLFFKSIRTNEFTRQVSLGNMFDEDKIEANLEDGILTIRLPYDLKKLTKEEPKKIPIK